MERCVSCHSFFPSKADACTGCGSARPTSHGFRAYAPALSQAGGGFEGKFFHDLAPLEASNFWFRARNELILWALKSYCPHFHSLLEIGCGTGFVLSAIAEKYPEASLHGSEIFVEGLSFAAPRLPSAALMQMDARDIPFQAEFDVIGAFDVLEHIEEDSVVLSQIYAALKPQGYLLMTVPQHPWLWSVVDEYSHHVRRYSANELHRKVQDAGFQILRSTSFVTTLLPLMAASRFMNKKASVEELDPIAEYRISSGANAILLSMLRLEQGLIRTGITLPVGGSRLVVAQKR
jgi:2-polyprenyl-3-methyl-5-hydroxy-6-metoxy-1,4-benzoquinol methylase